MASKEQFLEAVESISKGIGGNYLDEISWLIPELCVMCPDSCNPVVVWRVGRDGAELTISIIWYCQVSHTPGEQLEGVLLDLMADDMRLTANAIKMDGLRRMCERMASSFPDSLFDKGMEKTPLWIGSPRVEDKQSRSQP